MLVLAPIFRSTSHFFFSKYYRFHLPSHSCFHFGGRSCSYDEKELPTLDCEVHKLVSDQNNRLETYVGVQEYVWLEGNRFSIMRSKISVISDPSFSTWWCPFFHSFYIALTYVRRGGKIQVLPVGNTEQSKAWYIRDRERKMRDLAGEI